MSNTGQTTQLIVPSFIRMKFVDDKGYLTPEAAKFFDNFVNQIHHYFGNGMYILPQQTDSNMASFIANQFIGGLAYNSTNNSVQVNINGTIKTVTVS